ncbi:MAG: hypothetical protein HW387_1247 [Parachlamydiales bacterium]|nr:hypothetical protein [Parachlamydiales bacterium]
MTSRIENAAFDDSYFQQNLPQVYRATLQQFRRVTASFVFFNFLFLALFVSELLFFLIFLPFLMQSTLLAISLSGLFLTIFSYFVLHFYYAAKKPEQLVQLKTEFISSCRQLTGATLSESSHHLAIAAALTRLATYLEDFEWQFYRLPALLKTFSRPLSQLSAFCHWQDVLRFKQILIYAAIDEHLHQIRLTPTDLEAHASLANTYIALSKLFIEPNRSPNPSAFQKRKDSFNEYFRIAARLAIDEFQILNHYAPNDPWIHEQLARGYRELSMPQEELTEVETLIRLRPQDNELLLRLGTLYFEQGHNAKGLKIYEELKQAHFHKADDLIASYGKLSDALPSCEMI